MSHTIDLSGKVALITGASQGIGAQMARTFHAAGAAVVLNHPDVGSTGDDAKRLADELNALRAGSADVIAANVADPQAVQDMMASVKHARGGIDFLINNAAIIRDRTIAKMTLEEWNAVMDVNLSGVFYCCKFGLEIMRDDGAIVSMGSIAAIQGFYGQANYAAAKAGVQAMMRVAQSRSREARHPRQRHRARRHRHRHGRDDSGKRARGDDEERPARPLRHHGGGRAMSALFLCSPLASYVTGQTIEVNGGWRG